MKVTLFIVEDGVSL